MIDALGIRLKTKYEDVFRYSLPQRCYTIIRIDGRAFHTFTRGLERPYCKRLSDAMDHAAETLCKEAIGARFGYGQSDEYSFLLTDFDRDESEPWFSGNIQKIVSVSASIFTGAFNQYWHQTAEPGEKRKAANFDSRVFVIPPRADVIQYFIWRQNDATRNSLNILTSCYFGHKELTGKDSSAKHAMLHEKGVNWNAWATDFKRGRVVSKVSKARTVTFTHKQTQQRITKDIEELVWETDHEIPVFSRDLSYLDLLVPAYPATTERLK